MPAWMSRVQFRNYNIVYGDDAQPYSHTDFEFINTSVRIIATQHSTHLMTITSAHIRTQPTTEMHTKGTQPYV